MKDSEETTNAEVKKRGRPKKDYAADEGNAARLRAGKRSSNRNAGKEVDEGLAPAEEKEASAPTAEGDVVEGNGEPSAPEKTPETKEVAEGLNKGGVAGYAEGGEVVSPDEEKSESAAEAKAEEANPDMEKAEGEPKTAIEQFAAEESKEPQHRQKVAPVGEYTPPETGMSHEEHVDAYHNALMYGDDEGAKEHYKAMREHQFSEDRHRGKTEDHAQAEGDEYEAAANEVHGKYPHLNLHEDNVESDKVMALAHVYREHGDSAADALRKAAHELHGEKAAPKEEDGLAEGGEVKTMPTSEETPNSEESEIGEGNSPEAEPKESIAENPEETNPNQEKAVKIPEMKERNLRKKEIAAVPTASARTQPPKEENKSPSRMDAITAMKKARGQG